MATTIFTWGYYGWGNGTPQLVEAVDAVERDRGFAPPVFVDIRIRREVRAAGFQGAAFGRLLGEARHRWEKGLGNDCIVSGEGGIRIADPPRAGGLLDLALADPGRRVVFFCSCQWPMEQCQVACHRRTVADLVLEEARRRGEEVELAEWPGGAAGEATLDVEGKLLASVRRGRASIPLGDRLPAAGLRGLPWGSVLRLRCCGVQASAVAGPARFRSGAWELPVLETVTDGAASQRGEELRQAFGLEARSSAGGSR